MKWLTQRLFFLTFIAWHGVLEGGVLRHHSVTSLPLCLENKDYTHNELSYMIWNNKKHTTPEELCSIGPSSWWKFYKFVSVVT